MGIPEKEDIKERIDDIVGEQQEVGTASPTVRASCEKWGTTGADCKTLADETLSSTL